MWSDVVLPSNQSNKRRIMTPPPEATLETDLRTDCASCLNQNREANYSELPHHCVGTQVISYMSAYPSTSHVTIYLSIFSTACVGCTGLNRCTSRQPSSCCNVLANGQCMETCPFRTIVNSSTFICSKLFCLV